MGAELNARDGIMEVGGGTSWLHATCNRFMSNRQRLLPYTLVQVLFDSTVVRFGLRWTDRKHSRIYHFDDIYIS